MRILTNFAVLCITITIGIVVFEFAVRTFFPQFDPSGHVTFKRNKEGVELSEKRGKFRQIKNTGDYNILVSISDLGLRESKLFKTSTPKDIFVVGDSFSFGWGVEEEERFSNQLESLLGGTKVFNISIPTDFDGYDRLISYAKVNDANIANLIIGVTMENDIHNYNKPAKPSLQKDSKPTELLNLSMVKYFLRDRSAAYFFITSLIHKNAAFKKGAAKMGLITPNLAALSTHAFNKTAIINSAKRLKRLSKNFKSLILIIPSRALWVGSKEDRATADKTHSFFISEIKRLKIQFLDMKAALEQSGNPMAFHFKHDGHWTAAAHKLAAQMLAAQFNTTAKTK